MERSTKVLLIIYILVFTLFLHLLIPRSIGGAYQINMLSNIYLSDLGVSSHAVVNPTSVIAYISMIKILNLILATDILSLLVMVGAFSILIIIFSYNLLFRSVGKFRKVELIICLIYPLLLLGYDNSIVRGYVFSFTIPLCFVILFVYFNEKINKNNYAPAFILFILCYISIGFFWHTMHIMTYIIIILFLLIGNIKDKWIYNRYRTRLNLIILTSVIFLATWFFLRLIVVSHTVQILDFQFTIESLFQKGSFAGEYSYISDLPVKKLDYIRYLGYFAAYSIMCMISLKFITQTYKKNQLPNIYLIIFSVFIGDFIFQMLYFGASSSAGPRILYLISQPLLIVYLINKTLSYKNEYNWRFFITLLITIFFILNVFITSAFGVYTYIHQNPETNIDMATYESGSRWFSTYAYNSEGISDAHTIGNYQLYYILNRKSIEKDALINVSFRNLGYRGYSSIVSENYSNSYDSILILDVERFRKHLIFTSLESWNTFEPINPDILKDNSNIQLIYNDGNILHFK